MRQRCNHILVVGWWCRCHPTVLSNRLDETDSDKQFELTVDDRPTVAAVSNRHEYTPPQMEKSDRRHRAQSHPAQRRPAVQITVEGREPLYPGICVAGAAPERWVPLTRCSYW